jgi:NodT family efflux transporter outer membrane factor (OMF) lipoprotein
MRYAWLLLVVLLSGCALGPNYQRPTIASPPAFRNGDANPAAASLSDTKWFDLFQDDTLKQLVNLALEQNHDLRIAANRVLEARAQIAVARAELYPKLDLNASVTSIRNSLIGANTFSIPGLNLDSTYTQGGFSLNWELDIWGRLRRLTEAARAQYLASEEVGHGVVTTLVADVTTNYFNLRELDLELDIAHKTRDSANNSLKLITTRKNRGAASGLDVHQAEQFLYTASAQIAAIERSLGQTENALNVLLGRNPGDIPRGKALEDFKAPPEVPAGLPSALLERRPDIRQAEQTLVAANAEIGVARAAYFPQISLTGFLGAQSRALTNLFTGPARQWSFVPTLTTPIFRAGSLKAAIRFTEAEKNEALENYEKSIQNAFREVSDALIGYRKTAEQRAQEELLVGALRETDRLSRLRYQGGLDSYLQVLDAERNLFQGQLALAQLRRTELISVVELYRALGGSWQ